MSILISGAEGFIGRALCSRIEEVSSSRPPVVMDILPVSVRPGWIQFSQDISSSTWSMPAGLQLSPVDTVFHLAAVAEVDIEFQKVAETYQTNVLGTVNALDQLRPKRLVFTSSSSVYGHCAVDRKARTADNLQPLGTYAMTKVAGEKLLEEWARETGSVGCVLRLGNVVGEGCRGLIPFLVAHALRDREGDVPVMLRGQGRLLRDYVPISFVVDALLAASAVTLESGQVRYFNIGTGQAMTNRQVVEIVTQVLEEDGYALQTNYDTPELPSEAEHSLLDVETDLQQLGLIAPSVEETKAAIIEAAKYYIEQGQNDL